MTDLLKDELELTFSGVDHRLGGLDRLDVGESHRRHVKRLRAHVRTVRTSCSCAPGLGARCGLTVEAAALAPPMRPRFEDGDGGAD